MSHTPGPWHVEKENPNMLVVDVQDVSVCRVYQQPHDTWRAADTAALIAAAPDLLSALHTLVEHAMERYPHFESERGQRDIAAAITAITKARNA